MIQKRMEKCTGDNGDIDDIAKNDNIAMQKNDMAQMALLALWSRKVPKVSKVPSKFLERN